MGMLGPGAGPSSSHQIQQEPWEVKGAQFPSDLPALPQEHSLDLTMMCTNFLLVCVFSITATACTLQEKELISAAPKVSRNRPGKQYNDKSVDLSTDTFPGAPEDQVAPISHCIPIFSPTGIHLKNWRMQCN